MAKAGCCAGDSARWGVFQMERWVVQKRLPNHWVWLVFVDVRSGFSCRGFSRNLNRGWRFLCCLAMQLKGNTAFRGKGNNKDSRQYSYERTERSRREDLLGNRKGRSRRENLFVWLERKERMRRESKEKRFFKRENRSNRPLCPPFSFLSLEDGHVVGQRPLEAEEAAWGLPRERESAASVFSCQPRFGKDKKHPERLQ